jgi:hypothetical protein
MKGRWFKAVGWLYLPVSAAGVVCWVLAAVFCATVFVAVERHSHSVSDTFYGVFPYFACAFLLLDWLARRTAGRPEH